MSNKVSKEKGFIQAIVNILLNILIFIFGIVLLISIYIGVQTKILGKNYADFFGFSIFEVQTGSMEETISAGDWIIVKLTKNVKLNDIITYRLKGEYITHRIIEVYNGTFITRGDANNAKDDPIDQNQVVGKVVRILPNFGILRKTIFSPLVLIMLIVTLTLFNFAFKKNKSEHRKGIIDAIISKVDLYFNKPKNVETEKKEKPKVIIKDIESYDNSYEIGRIRNSNSNEDELSKTAVYRVISVDSNEVNNKFKKEQKPEEKKEPEEVEKELEKTAMYRVVSVDDGEVHDKFKSEEVEEVEEKPKEEELEKTAMYRVISVDSSEIDDTLLEIAKNEMKGNKAAKSNKIEVKEEKPEESSEESKKEINFDLLKLKNGNRKPKNAIDAAIIIKEEELGEIVDIFLHNNSSSITKSVKNTFVSTYIKSKYYGDGDIEQYSKNSISKIKDIIKTTANDLIKSKGEKNKTLIEKYADVFIMIANLKQANDSIVDLKAKNGFYKKEIMKYSSDWDSQGIEIIISKIEEIQSKYNNILENFLEKSDTNLFELNFNQLSTKKNMYGLNLNHNISFSKVYSDYIIDKTYTEGIIAEDKILVLLTLLVKRLITDMTSSKFNLKYILHIPESLYSKEKKFEKLLKMIEDDYAKANVFILITIEDLLKNKTMAKKIKKMGYKFALVFNKEVEINEKDRGYIYIADYIFVDKKMMNIAKILPLIPDELLNNIIYENIEEKVGGFEVNKI